jgi:mono/diheme cytochrome c family protein
MKFVQITLVLSCLALFIFACNQTANTNNTANSANKAANINTTANIPKTPVDELAAARAIYTEKCVKCHKENGSGGIGEADGKKFKAANFKSEGLKKESDEDLIAEIELGVVDEGMPAFKGTLTDEQIKSLVKFIRKEFQGK